MAQYRAGLCGRQCHWVLAIVRALFDKERYWRKQPTVDALRENAMTMKQNGAAPSRPRRGRPPQMAPFRDAEDMALADESKDVACIHGLVATAERSAQLIDDGMNATEASEDRHAQSEAQAMR